LTELGGLYAIWEREVRVYLRERSRVLSSIVSPILWLVVYGGGLGSQISVSGLSYQAYIYPGIIVMALIFSSVFYGASIVWDKKVDFLKEVLVAPVRRSTAFLGKVAGGATDGLIQASIILLLSPFFGVTVGLNLVLVYMYMIILLVGLVSIGLIIGSFMESSEGFSLIGGFIIFPLFFLSGALFPLTNLPDWLLTLTLANPLTYGVDAMRGLMLGSYRFGLFVDFSILLTFAAVMVGIGSLAFEHMKV
jgi:ABC-2 type transport system permease protein